MITQYSAVRQAEPINVINACDLPDTDPTQTWLVEGVWPNQAVGVLGGPPKSMKTWTALGLVLAVASGTRFLGTYAAIRGRVLIFPAEDGDAILKGRLLALCRSMDLKLEDLDLRIIRTARLNLCDPFQYEAFARLVAEEKPSLLVLDPFVRIFSGNEDDSAQVSRVLGLLRKLQREVGTSILLVHHFKKSGSGTGGAYLRGSGDIHAWGDTNLFIRRSGPSRSSLHIEHRGHATPDPFSIELSGDPLCLRRGEVQDELEVQGASVRDRILEVLAEHAEGLGRGHLREIIRIKNERLGETLDILAAEGVIEQKDRKWTLKDGSVPHDL